VPSTIDNTIEVLLHTWEATQPGIKVWNHSKDGFSEGGYRVVLAVEETLPQAGENNPVNVYVIVVHIELPAFMSMRVVLTEVVEKLSEAAESLMAYYESGKRFDD